MFTYTITIGRNVGHVPMEDSLWHAFGFDVIEVLEDVAYDAIVEEDDWAIEVHETTTRPSVWRGVAEDSLKIALLAERALSPDDVQNVRDRLGMLAREYKQDAIALTLGTSELIGAAS